jgi:hypothetical protein
LSGILKRKPDIPVYVHRNWNNPHSFKGFVVPEKNRVEVQNGKECPKLADGLYVTSSHFSPDYGSIFEHACFLRAGTVDVLITGCCHPGLDVFLDERLRGV